MTLSSVEVSHVSPWTCSSRPSSYNEPGQRSLAIRASASPDRIAVPLNLAAFQHHRRKKRRESRSLNTKVDIPTWRNFNPLTSCIMHVATYQLEVAHNPYGDRDYKIMHLRMHVRNLRRVAKRPIVGAIAHASTHSKSHPVDQPLLPQQQYCKYRLQRNIIKANRIAPHTPTCLLVQLPKTKIASIPALQSTKRPRSHVVEISRR